MARGLPRDTETNPAYWEILHEFCQQFMSAFPDCLKDFAIVYYVTIEPYNSKSSLRYHVCLSALVFSKGTRFVHQVNLWLRLNFVDIFGRI